MTNQLTTKEAVHILYSDAIIDPVHAMRTDLDREALFDLAENIKQNGLINPITVRPVPWCEVHKKAYLHEADDKETCTPGTRYEVVAGHRRFSACKIAGIIRIACVVRELSDTEVFSIKAAENLERADVDPVDEAKFIAEYMNVSGKTIPEIAESLKRSPTYVRDRLEIGMMPEYMQYGLKNGTLKLGVALKLNQITDDKVREIWTGMAIRDGISIAQADYWLHGWRINQLPGGSNTLTPPSDFVAGTPETIKFKCALSGIEEDARQYRTLLIHESQLDVFNTIAAEYQKDIATEATAPNGGEAPDIARA